MKRALRALPIVIPNLPILRWQQIKTEGEKNMRVPLLCLSRQHRQLHRKSEQTTRDVGAARDFYGTSTFVAISVDAFPPTDNMDAILPIARALNFRAGAYPVPPRLPPRGSLTPDLPQISHQHLRHVTAIVKQHAHAGAE